MSELLLFSGAAGAVASEDPAAPAPGIRSESDQNLIRILPREETLRFECEICNRRFRVTVEHYDKWECCGRVYWALRPLRFGPLQAFLWPGTPEMLRYKQQQQALANQSLLTSSPTRRAA